MPKKFLIVGDSFKQAQVWFDKQKESHKYTSQEAVYANITAHTVVTKDSGMDKLKGIIPDEIHFVDNPMICYYMWQEILMIEERMKNV